MRLLLGRSHRADTTAITATTKELSVEWRTGKEESLAILMFYNLLETFSVLDLESDACVPAACEHFSRIDCTVKQEGVSGCAVCLNVKVLARVGRSGRRPRSGGQSLVPDRIGPVVRKVCASERRSFATYMTSAESAPAR
jgi:hypothetical protein